MTEVPVSTQTSAGNRKVSLVLPSDLAASLESEAQRRGVRLTTVLIEHLERGAARPPDPAPPAALPVLPTPELDFSPLEARMETMFKVQQTQLESVFRERTRMWIDKLSPLLARGALEATVARSLTVQILGELVGYEAGKELAGDAYDLALSQLAPPSEGVRTLLALEEE